MKTVFLLLLAMLVVKTTAVQAQNACSKGYTSCVDKCVGKASQSLQNTCIEACQSQNNVCAGKAFGGDNLTKAATVDKSDASRRRGGQGDGCQACRAGKADGCAPRQVAAPAKQPAERRPQ